MQALWNTFRTQRSLLQMASRPTDRRTNEVQPRPNTKRQRMLPKARTEDTCPTRKTMERSHEREEPKIQREK